MTDVRIHSIESRIDLIDSEVLLTSELIEKLAAIIRQRLEQDNRLRQDADQDRKLTEGR